MGMKNFFATAGLMLCLLPAACNRSPLEEKLRELDGVIADRPRYAVAFAQRADSLRQAIVQTGQGPEAWEAAHALYGLFRYYQIDSSVRYMQLMEQLAGEEPDRKLESTFCRAETGISLRRYNESARILSVMDTLSMNDLQKSRYYNLLLQLYATEIRDESLPEEAREEHDVFRDDIRRRLIACPGTTESEKKRRQAIQAYKDGNIAGSIRMLEDLLRTDPDLHAKASAAWSLSLAYNLAGDKEQRMYWLAQSAIYDLQVPVREYHSLHYLANLLYEEGQLARASRYSQRTLEDALDCNFNAWIYNSAAMQLNIVKAVEFEEAQRRRISVFVILLLSFLFITVALLLLNALRQSRKIHATAREMETMNAQLEEANKIKEGYVFRYVNLSARYLGLVEEYRHSMRMTLKESGEEALKQMLRQPSGIGDDYKQFYRTFDETFLGIFPDFVEKVNSLLREDARFTLGPDGELPTGLRILAAIRLGITDSGKIAQFLNCAPTSVYTHRSKIRKNALCPPGEFEERLSKI